MTTTETESTTDDSDFSFEGAPFERVYSTTLVSLEAEEDEDDLTIVSVPSSALPGPMGTGWLRAAGLQPIGRELSVTNETLFLAIEGPVPLGLLRERTSGFPGWFLLSESALTYVFEAPVFIAEQSPAAGSTLLELVKGGGIVGGALAANAAMGPVGFLLVPAGIFLIHVADKAGPVVGEALGDYVARRLKRRRRRS